MPYETTHINLLPKQHRALACDALESLYSGAYRAGKSRLLCYRAVMRAQDRRARVGMTRKRGTDLKRTTLHTLLEPDGDLPPVLPPDSYVYHKEPGNESITLHGGGTIIPFACDDPLRVRSMSLTDCVADECVELDKDEWEEVSSRCSVSFTKADGTKHKPTLMGATNPDSPAHWLYKRFFEDTYDAYDRALIETSAVDNYFLDDSYFRRLNHLQGVPRLRYVFGKWVASEGLVYHMWSPGRHVMHNGGPWGYYVAGTDWGFTDPVALRIHGCRYNDETFTSHVVAEIYQPGLTTPDFVEMLVAASKVYSPIVFVVDPSAADLRAQMIRADLQVIEADNRLEPGIRCMQMSLGDPGAYSPAPPTLTMEPKQAGNLEYGLYRWKQRPRLAGQIGIPTVGETGSLQDTPVDANNHALDADRYARMAICAGVGRQQGMTWYGPQRQAPANDVVLARGADGRMEQRPDPANEALWGDDGGNGGQWSGGGRF